MICLTNTKTNTRLSLDFCSVLYSCINNTDKQAKAPNLLTRTLLWSCSVTQRRAWAGHVQYRKHRYFSLVSIFSDPTSVSPVSSVSAHPYSSPVVFRDERLSQETEDGINLTCNIIIRGIICSIIGPHRQSCKTVSKIWNNVFIHTFLICIAHIIFFTGNY